MPSIEFVGKLVKNWNQCQFFGIYKMLSIYRIIECWMNANVNHRRQNAKWDNLDLYFIMGNSSTKYWNVFHMRFGKWFRICLLITDYAFDSCLSHSKPNGNWIFFHSSSVSSHPFFWIIIPKTMYRIQFTNKTKFRKDKKKKEKKQ